MFPRFIDVHTHHLQHNPDTFSIVCALPDKDDGESAYSWGIHPCFIQQPEEQLKQLESVMSHDRWIAVGECGLDKLSPIPLSLQTELFESQILLSERIQKPLIIHCVKAWAELIAIRRRMKPNQAWIIHGFRGKKELAEQLLRENLYLSFGQYYHEEALCSAWPDRLLLETDEAPCVIAELYQNASRVLRQSEEILQNQIRENCARAGVVL